MMRNQALTCDLIKYYGGGGGGVNKLNEGLIKMSSKEKMT